MSKFILSTFLVATLSAGAASANDDVVPHYSYHQFNQEFRELDSRKFDRRMGGKKISIAGRFKQASDSKNIVTNEITYSVMLSKDDEQGNVHRSKRQMTVWCDLPDTPEVLNLLDVLEKGDSIIITGTIKPQVGTGVMRQQRLANLEKCSVKH